MSGAIVDARLADAFAACEKVVRRRARNFWYGLRLTPEPKRSAMYAIYAWMREADDIADADRVPTAERRARLERFGRDTESALAGESGDGRPLWIALAWVANRHRLDAADFRDMLAGQTADLDPVAMSTWADLRLQCYRVASTVGLVCIRVWGVASGPEVGSPERPSIEAHARSLAIDRGLAFQLTNILRDVREDREAGRVYLPAEEFERFGIDVDRLLAWTEPTRCAEFMAFQIERAREHYRKSEGLERFIAADCVATSWALHAIYRRLLERIARDPRAALVGPRARVPTWEKLWIGFRAKRLVGSAPRAALPEVATP